MVSQPRRVKLAKFCFAAQVNDSEPQDQTRGEIFTDPA